MKICLSYEKRNNYSRYILNKFVWIVLDEIKHTCYS